MKDELFRELLESVKQGAAILRGEREPSRILADVDAPDVTAIREQYGLTQEKFAALLGISIGTLRNWEQRRRVPEGPARVLLKVAAKHPDAVLDAVAGGTGRRPHPHVARSQSARKRGTTRKSA